ncbi:pilin [Neptuniibacter halophilus]|uniref:pilin n=1 Tax=Neptuniibacter halophilus TaxID=651666 RepID=UPI00257341DA|nr:prepilin-type N-terminal cleavage/methylation domain-containing protein [Neptuniibacter halophilus]
MQKNTGFTLIELMLVIAVIGILAAIAVPTYQRYIHSAKSVDLIEKIETLRERVAIEISQANWPAQLQTPPQSGLWPAPLKLNPELLKTPHFLTQTAISGSNRPIAVFMASDADGRFIIDEARKHLPESWIHGYYNRTMLSVWLADPQPSGNTQPPAHSSPAAETPSPTGSTTASTLNPGTPVTSHAAASLAVQQSQQSPQTSNPPVTQAPAQVTNSQPPAVQSTHIQVVTIPPECIKRNGGYYHRNPHRPNCPL